MWLNPISICLFCVYKYDKSGSADTEHFQSSGWIKLICLLQIVSEGVNKLSLTPNRSWLILYRKICVCMLIFFIEWRIYEGVIRKGDLITNVNTGKTFEVSLRLLTILVLLQKMKAEIFCGWSLLSLRMQVPSLYQRRNDELEVILNIFTMICESSH